MLTITGLAVIGIVLVGLAYSGVVAVSAPYLPIFLIVILAWTWFAVEVGGDERGQKGIVVLFSAIILVVLMAVTGPLFIDFMAQEFASNELDLTSTLLLYMFPAFFAMALVYLLLKIGPSKRRGGRR